MHIRKFVVIGPESTGKSTLCTQLATHYNTLWVPEYAREYLEKNGTEYQMEDLWKIAKGQMSLEDEITREVQKNSLIRKTMSPPIPKVFIDTDLYVIKVWSEYVFNECDNRILDEIAYRKYDGYLLCNTDLPWVADDLREYPDLKVRHQLFLFYKELLESQSTPWTIISGNYEERLTNAIQFVEKF